MFLAVLALSSIFSALGALMAFIIFHNEYGKHLTLKKRVFWISLKAAAATFLFFTILILVIALIFRGFQG
ncbi:MAG: hypothetical protein FJY82_09225 [Candidatus Aminicenantes bacterium]|nr:hypothetical protein [Candidatus Aminicenantes bacterium]